MTVNEMNEWVDANQHYLSLAISLVHDQLDLYAEKAEENSDKWNSIQARRTGNLDKIKHELDQFQAPPALENLVNIFGLSSFERDILVTAAAVELDGRFVTSLSRLQGNANAYLPTFSLMLNALEGAHWSAISPNGALRYWRMIELNTEQLISKAPIRIDEHLLHYLAGVNQLDERLTGIVEPFSGEVELVPTHIQLANEMIGSSIETINEGSFRPVELTGDNHPDKDNIAIYVCRKLGLQPFFISTNAIPSSAKEITELARVWNREAALKSYALILDYTDIEPGDKQRMHLIRNFIDNVQSLFLIKTRQVAFGNNTRYVVFDVGKPTAAEQYDLWKNNLDHDQLISEEELKRLVAQFNFSTKAIKDAIRAMAYRSRGATNNTPIREVKNAVWKICCVQSRPNIGELAQRIEPVAGMDDLVLPEAQKEIIKDLIVQAKFRSKVYNDWGFATRHTRGLGITALFAGESGTGKTMASEVLANELALDLYRIDLSQVVNKYIGETEKNLKKIFDAAEDGGAILLFDEADALFGKRSEVKDSHDRYANVEISYLLQRMEAYRGLAILTTNMKNVMDKAWMRRIRFVVQFQFPDMDQRAEIWRKIFPQQTPLNGLDISKLARLNIAGGNIKNIAMSAAFIAASEGKSVGMQHVQRALRSEYDKIEKPLTNNEMALLQ